MKASLQPQTVVLLLLLALGSATARFLQQQGNAGRGHEQAASRQQRHVFDFGKAEGGAAAFLGRLEAGKVANIMQRARFNGNAAKLADLLDADADLGVDVISNALLFRCEGLAVNVSEAGAAAEVASGLSAGDADPLTDQAFTLSSRPSAAKKIVLDFLGGDISNTAWNAYVGQSVINLPAYDKDGNPAAFSTPELNDIVAIWRAVAEDYAIFDVDVTTIRPATFSGNMRVLIGGDGAWYGRAGGVAYVSSWGNEYYQPAFVFPQNLGPNHAKYIWEAVSHEVGHTLGLLHDGVIGGPTYYQGQEGSDAQWAPIMGAGYFKSLTTFDHGEYTNSNNQQDDIAVVSTFLPLIPQSNGNSIATATPLTVNVSGATATATAAGIVSQAGVPDVFSFVAGAAGTATLRVEVTAPWAAGVVRSNLDVEATVYDATGAAIGTINPAGVDSADGLGVLAAAVVLPAAGVYYVAVAGAGAGDPKATGYSNYGSRGQFALTATFPAVAVSPSPSPALPSPSPAPAVLPSPSPSPTPVRASPSPAPGVGSTGGLPLIRVSGITMSKSCIGSRCTCIAKVYVVASATNTAVNHASVPGTWTASNNAWAPFTLTGSTATRGYVQFTAKQQSIPSSCTLAVTGAAPAGYQWDPTSVFSAMQQM